MSARTPGPWIAYEISPTKGSELLVHWRVGNPQCIAGVALSGDSQRDEANAAFIVLACNAHDELVAALREQTDFLASLHTTYRHDGRLAARTKAHLTAARAALAKVQP